MKKPPENAGVIADGREPIFSSHAYKQQAQAIRRKMYQDALGEWSLAPWWQKPFLKWKIEKTIKKELEKLAPPQGLYSKAR
jgi:hypothetical protein